MSEHLIPSSPLCRWTQNRLPYLCFVDLAEQKLNKELPATPSWPCATGHELSSWQEKAVPINNSTSSTNIVLIAKITDTYFYLALKMIQIFALVPFKLMGCNDFSSYECRLMWSIYEQCLREHLLCWWLQLLACFYMTECSLLTDSGYYSLF